MAPKSKTKSDSCAKCGVYATKNKDCKYILCGICTVRFNQNLIKKKDISGASDEDVEDEEVEEVEEVEPIQPLIPLSVSVSDEATSITSIIRAINHTLKQYNKSS